MALDHTNCDHPRTPAGRAACRKARAKGIQLPAKAETLPIPTTGTGTTPKASTKALKRPGTQIKGLPDMADIPRPFVVSLRSAKELGWVARVGETYNDTERRIEIFAPHGTICLVWKADNPHGLHATSFRPKDSSVWTRCVSNSAAFIMGKEGVNAA